MTEETPAAEAVVEPIVAPETPEAEAPVEAQEAPAEAAPELPEPPAPPQRKSPITQLQGRVGYLTKTLNERDSEMERLRRENETYQSLLNARGAPAEGEQPPTPPRAPTATPAPGTTDFQAAVRREAEVLAGEQAFNAECNRVYESGQSEYKDTWKESVDLLRDIGVLRRDVLEASIATGEGAKVLHTLAEDPEEAARIAALTPIRMAAELTKLALQSAQPSVPTTSRAPPPIRPVGGAVKPELDIVTLSKSGDMAAYVAARKAQGSRWAR